MVSCKWEMGNGKWQMANGRWQMADGKGDDGAWVLQESVVLRRDGAALPFIPFVFHGPRNSRPEPDRLPQADIIAANLDHYRLDADFKHGLHFAALPTAWVSGFDKATPLRIGSSAAWVSDIPGASSGFLELTQAGDENNAQRLHAANPAITLRFHAQCLLAPGRWCSALGLVSIL